MNLRHFIEEMRFSLLYIYLLVWLRLYCLSTLLLQKPTTDVEDSLVMCTHTWNKLILVIVNMLT